MRCRPSAIGGAIALFCLAGCAADRDLGPPPIPAQPPAAETKAPSQTGTATYYSRTLNHRKMADGGRFDPNSDSAASKTLPLGSKAEVTNLRNGKSAIVTIRDRGPYAKDAILDVSPKTADQLDMKHEGKAPVKVRPLPAPERTASAEPVNRP